MNTNINRVGGLMLPSKRPLYMGNILNVAPKIGNNNLPMLIRVSLKKCYLSVINNYMHTYSQCYSQVIFPN